MGNCVGNCVGILVARFVYAHISSDRETSVSLSDGFYREGVRFAELGGA